MSVNPTSSNDGGQASVVPRDVRLLHLIFATQGIQNYQDHVPLQLMDFAHSMYKKDSYKRFYVYVFTNDLYRIYHWCIERCLNI